MSIYDRLLAIPFVFNRVRPLVVGGVDMAPGYRKLAVQADEVVLDVGCGTGDALEHLSSFGAYYGFDPDKRAVEYANKRAFEHGGRITLEARSLTAGDVDRIQPHRVILSGLLHHLSDAKCIELFRNLSRSSNLRRS